MPNYRVIVQETKSYFVEADNKENAGYQAMNTPVMYQSCTLDRCDIDEVEDE